MKLKRIASVRLGVLLLTLSLLLSGCLGPMVLPAAPATTEEPLIQRPAPTEAPTHAPVTTGETAGTTNATEPVIDPNDEALIRWQNAGRRDYLPDEAVDMVPFSEMRYVRPDVEAYYAEADQLVELAKRSEDVDALLSAFYALYDRYVSFYSMDALANVLYSLDTTKNEYQDEYNYCEAETPTVEEKMETVYKTFAASACRDQLEELYFSEGFFDKYDHFEVYTNPEYLRLSQEEAELLTEYRALTADVQVNYLDQTKPLDEWLDTMDYTVYIGALQAYYEQYNPKIGDVYVRLIKVRQQLAAVLGYDSYAAYSYDISYGRDYTPEEGAAFLDSIRTYLVPVLKEAQNSRALSRLQHWEVSSQALHEMLGSAAQNIGGAVWDAYRFMRAYALCDVEPSAKKLEASFQTYLYDYEAPFVFLNAVGNSQDYTTFSHEFGHFTDSYHNYGADEDLETAETFSQSMEFLALLYTDQLSAGEKEKLVNINLLDLLQTFVYQAAFADFEARIYALDPNEITVEKINETFLQCNKDFGINEIGFEFYYSQSWIDVLHFFEVPYYIISYCVSAENALQVYRLEAETKGEGVAAYFRLLDRSYGAGVQQVMEDAGLDSPFRDGVLEQTAAFFREALSLKQN